MSGVFGFLQYTLSWLVEHKVWRHQDVNYLQLGCFAAMYFFPLLVMREEWKERKARAAPAPLKP